MATKGYQSYRGRMPGWKKILIALLVAILVCALAVLVLQRNQVFDADGVHIKLPFGVQETRPSSGSTDEEGRDDGLIIDIQEPEAQMEELHGRSFDAALLQGETFGALQEGEHPGLTMKAANGAVLYGSVQDAAASMVREKIANRRAVARISCFADTQKADGENGLAVMSVSGKAWRDPDGKAWLDPYNTEVTGYLTQIIQDCAELGFAEIVLDDVQFPNYGVVDRVTYGDRTDTPETRIAAIGAFLDAARAAAEEAGVTLAVALPAALLETGTDSVAGWDLADIAGRVDRIYMEAADQSAADSARAAVAALREDVPAEVFFVAETAAPITGGSYVLR